MVAGRADVTRDATLCDKLFMRGLQACRHKRWKRLSKKRSKAGRSLRERISLFGTSTCQDMKIAYVSICRGKFDTASLVAPETRSVSLDSCSVYYYGRLV